MWWIRKDMLLDVLFGYHVLRQMLWLEHSYWANMLDDTTYLAYNEH